MTEFAHDLVFLENRRTPKVVSTGQKYEPTDAEGKITKRRAATEAEEKVIKRGDWVRVNEQGDKPTDSGYKRKKSKVRPGPHTNSIGSDLVRGARLTDSSYMPMFSLMFAQAGSEEDGYDGVTHAGLAVVAKDTGRVLLAQRSMDPTDDADVQETWEFPGGGLDDGEEAFEGACREFREETRLPFPMGEVVGGWRSDDGIYQGFVFSVDQEFPVENWTPTDEVQTLTWFTREDVESHSNLRPEVESGTDWDMIFESVSEKLPDQEDEPMAASMGTEQIEPEQMEYEPEPEYEPGAYDLDGPLPVHGIIAPEEMPSGDKRAFGSGAMTRRPLRLPLRDTTADMGGHGGAVHVGSVDRMMRSDGMIHFEGALMPEMAEALAMKMEFMGGRYGVSVDGDQGNMDEARTEETNTLWFDKIRAAGLTAVDIPAFHEAYVAFGPHPDMPNDEALTASAFEAGNYIGASAFARGPGWVTDPKATNRIHDYWTKPGQEGFAKVGWGTPGDFTRAKKLIGAKIAEHSPDKMRFLNQIIAQWHFDALGYWPGDLGKPGNAPDTAENRRRAATHAASAETVDQELHDEIVALMTKGLDNEGLTPVEDDVAVWETVLVSSAGVTVKPPLGYFHEHKSEDKALTLHEPDAFGIRRVTGFAAQWGVCHVGMQGRCVEPPRTHSDDYPAFHLGVTHTTEGKVYTGVLTYGVGHRDADTILSESPDQAYFDNVNNAWAAVRVGENDEGIWFSGYVLPGVPEEHLVKIAASGQVSGEWLGKEMRACLTVNVPGFAVERPSVTYDAAGNVLALAASAFGQGEVECAKEHEGGSDEDKALVAALATEVMDRIDARNMMSLLKQEQARNEMAIAEMALTRSEF